MRNVSRTLILSALGVSLFFANPLHLCAQAFLNHSAVMTIDGKSNFFYSVEFAEKADTVRRTTTYFDEAKKAIRREITNFSEKPLKLFSNHIEDFRYGEILTQTLTKDRYAVKRREKTGASQEEKSLSAPGSIISTLVSVKIAQSMEALERGESVKFLLALPLREMTTEMTMTKTGIETVGGVSCLIVRLEPANFLLKALMGEPSYFYFERVKPHRFMQYRGILGLPSADGLQQNGIVRMKY